ncbi:hypothetical protein [Vibrio sp.]|uniref:hypothetical protein n=1 Tax=Vibrio sp. TaxID=678 RepID=UPI003D0F4FD5
MKKLFPLACVLLASPSLVNAAGDPQLAVGMALDQQLSAVLEIDKQYRLTLGNKGMAFDYIAKRGQFQGNVPFTWYVGGGAWAEWKDDFGVRVPLGVNWNFSRGWDMYGQVHPELNLHRGPKLQLGAALGVKYSF